MVLPKNVIWAVLGLGLAGTLIFAWGSLSASIEKRKARVALAEARYNERRAEEYARTAHLRRQTEELKEKLALSRLKTSALEARYRQSQSARREAQDRMAAIPEDAPCESRYLACRSAAEAMEVELRQAERIIKRQREERVMCMGALTSCEREREALDELLMERDVSLLKEEKKPKVGWFKRHFGCAAGPSATVGWDGEAAAGVGVTCGWRFP